VIADAPGFLVVDNLTTASGTTPVLIDINPSGDGTMHLLWRLGLYTSATAYGMMSAIYTYYKQ